MHTKKFLFVISALILVSLACSLNVNLPMTTDVITGEEEQEEISIPDFPDLKLPAKITLGFGAGEMNLSRSDSDNLISGIATFNVSDLKPDISISDGSVKIKTGNLDIEGIPNFNKKVKNTWDLSFGTHPIDLTIKAGAYVGQFELGGLSLSALHISDGASEVDVNFGQPNQVVMETFRYETGASNITLRNLANANIDTMIFQSGAGNYELDFSGQLQSDTNVFIETGLSSLTISVPEDTKVDLEVEGGLTNITSRGNWIQSGNQYQIQAEGPTIHIVVEMNAGNIILDHP